MYLTRNYKLASLIPWLTRSEPITSPLNVTELRRVYDVAAANIQRADALAETVATAFWSAEVARGRAPGALPTAAEMYTIGFTAWEYAAYTYPMPFGSGIEAVLSAYLVQAWTTFETLAGDLWETALNVHPSVLAELRGGRNTNKDDKTVKQIPLWMLQKNGYNLGDKMGTLLRNKFNFDSLVGIREAYDAAFCENNAQIVEPLNHPAIDALNRIRQIFVHRAGVVDDEYVRKTKTNPFAVTADEGQPLLLDGDILAKLFNAAFPEIIKMIRSVDEWLVHHPQA